MCFEVICMLVAFFHLNLSAVQGGGSVTYSTNRVCVLKGTSVVLPCKYDFSWIGEYLRGEWYKDQRWSGRVWEHSNSKYPDCGLKIDKLTDNHSGVYYFRFYTKLHQSWISGTPGITVTVTDLEVKKVYAWDENQIKVTCSSSCSLADPEYVWYKNGQRLQDKTTASILVREVARYSCAVRHYEHSPARYKPTCVSVSISPSDGIKEGTSVTLTCSSDANPPVHTYTWYMKSGAESLVRGTGESISFNVTSDTSGLYYCEAQNEFGSQNSGEVAVPSKGGLVISMAITSGIIIAVILALMLMVFVRRYTMARRNTTTTQSVHSDVQNDTYTALNPRTTSSEYDTLQNVRSVSDTYMPLQRTAQTSVYETLQRRETPPTEMELKDLRRK